MPNLNDFRSFFVMASLVGALFIAWPVSFSAFPSEGGEKFSELYVLGPNRMGENYPFNVKANENYRIFLGTGNHMASSAYYVVYVKFRNQSEPLPNPTAYMPSPLPALYEYRVFLRDGGVWEAPLDFSLCRPTISGNKCSLESLTINGLPSCVNKVGLWDSENEGFFFELFFELWIYDPQTKDFRYHNRFVGIWLNMTLDVD